MSLCCSQEKKPFRSPEKASIEKQTAGKWRVFWSPESAASCAALLASLTFFFLSKTQNAQNGYDACKKKVRLFLVFRKRRERDSTFCPRASCIQSRERKGGGSRGKRKRKCGGGEKKDEIVCMGVLLSCSPRTARNREPRQTTESERKRPWWWQRRRRRRRHDGDAPIDCFFSHVKEKSVRRACFSVRLTDRTTSGDREYARWSCPYRIPATNRRGTLLFFFPICVSLSSCRLAMFSVVAKGL